MKTILVILLLALSMFSYSQTVEEWTKQKKTQIKYLLQQIAANKVYLDYIEKGYGIARNGLNTIQSIKKGDFNLHSDFVSSLIKVNPKIKNYAKDNPCLRSHCRRYCGWHVDDHHAAV